MGNGYQIPRSDEEVLPDQLENVKGRLKELEAPDGSQIHNTLAVISSPTTGHSTASGYALSTSTLELTRVTFTVPAGVTRALVLATANTSVTNQSNSLLDIIRGIIDINGTQIGTAGPVMIDPLHVANINSSGSRVVTGLSAGGTFYVRMLAYNDFNRTGAASASNNVCNLDVAVVFLP